MSKSQLRKEYEARFGVQKGWLRLYDAKGNEIYYENSDGWWEKSEYDAQGNEIYCENSRDRWVKWEYDAQGNEIYCESSEEGIMTDKRNNLEGKIVTIDGKEYQLTGINRRK